MGKIFLYGGMGAIVNCAIAIKASSVTLEHLIAEILVQPFSAVRTLTPAFLGFMFGTAVLLVWSFLRAIIVRFLLGYNGWFLNPKNPVNKIWYVLMLVLVGKKNLGAGNYQQMLPTLSVPPLTMTLKKYLDSVKPLLSPEEYVDTEKAVQNFKKQGGKKLQFYLKLRSWTSRNWIADWWIKYIYLRQRTPISFNSNYFADGCKCPKTKSQLDRAAMLMNYAVKFTCDYKRGKVKNMLAQNLVPFCLDGMRFVCCTCRIPGKEEDKIKTYDRNKCFHTVVIRNGKMYKVIVKHQDGTPYPPGIIKKQLEQIMESAGDQIDETGFVSSFTGLPRTEWAEIRERLLKDPVNKETLELIQSSYQLYVLSDDEPDKQEKTILSQKLFHGNLYDRWFDKCITVVIYRNGLIGSNIEHAPLDATVCGQYWEYIMKGEKYDENGRVADPTAEENKKFTVPNQPEQLHWNLKGFEDDLERSKKHLQAMIDDSDLIVMHPSYGKGFPKKCRLSPDGWFQMALQLTYFRLHHKLVLTYESATTRLYYKGRTETIRPVSDESKKWVEAMEDDSCTDEERKALLKAAISCQERRKFEAMRGLGIDRHLFGLYIIARWLKMDPLPDLFTDKAFQMPFQLSTSQTPLSFVYPYDEETSSTVGGFGTVTEDGYGISYLISGEEKVHFVIHSRKCCPETSSSKFAETLNSSMEDMKALYKF